MAASPTQRSLNYCRKFGGDVAVVEKWNPVVKIRNDLFGFCDILWVSPDGVHHYIQSTSDNGGHLSKRVQKVRRKAAARRLSKYPHVRIVVHGWKKSGPRGQRKKWNVRIVYPFENSKEAA